MNDARLITCHDCGVKEGEIHKFGCDMERCPFCGGQLITCMCCYKELGLIDKENGNPRYEYLTEETFNNGLNIGQEDKWLDILKKKVRIPYVRIPVICALCGESYPVFFSDDDWDKYVIPELQDKVLCKKCYKRMKELFPKGWKVSEKYEP